MKRLLALLAIAAMTTAAHAGPPAWKEWPGGTKLESAEALLIWAANKADYAMDAAARRDDTKGMPPQDAHAKVFEPNAGGVEASGQAVFYKNVLWAFDIPAFVIDFGEPEGGPSHSSVVIPHDGAFYLFDPTFAATFRKEGELVPIRDLLAGSLDGVEIEELPLARRDFLASTPDAAVCRTEPVKTGAFYVCSIGEASFLDHYLTGWAHLLEKADIPVGVETFPALMRKGFFNVGYGAGPEIRERFLALLAEHDIPMK